MEVQLLIINCCILETSGETFSSSSWKCVSFLQYQYDISLRYASFV